jgi:hypothetical protein
MIKIIECFAFILLNKELKMKFLQIVGLFLALVVVANGGKVKWGSDGKPIIEASKKPIKGCNKAKLNELARDNNSTVHCK